MVCYSRGDKEKVMNDWDTLTLYITPREHKKVKTAMSTACLLSLLFFTCLSDLLSPQASMAINHCSIFSPEWHPIVRST